MTAATWLPRTWHLRRVLEEFQISLVRHALAGVKSKHSFGNLKADLHGTILSHATSLRHAYDTKKSRRILKHVLKPYDNRGLNVS